MRVRCGLDRLVHTRINHMDREPSVKSNFWNKGSNELKLAVWNNFCCIGQLFCCMEQLAVWNKMISKGMALIVIPYGITLYKLGNKRFDRMFWKSNYVMYDHITSIWYQFR